MPDEGIFAKTSALTVLAVKFIKELLVISESPKWFPIQPIGVAAHLDSKSATRRFPADSEILSAVDHRIHVQCVGCHPAQSLTWRNDNRNPAHTVALDAVGRI